MDEFDRVVMIMGGLLIISGLILFLSGKKANDSNHQVEVMGVKLNTTNPSIFLIILGIGLLLTPRLLPKHSPSQVQQDTSSETQLPITTVELPQNPSKPAENERKAEQRPANTSSVFLPQGNWQLSGFEENGIDLTGFRTGSISFSNRVNNQVQWNITLTVMDIWGNAASYQYSGSILYNGNFYQLQIASSNEPNFIATGFIPLDLKMDPGSVLHMGYSLNMNNMLLHWVQ